MGIFTFNNVMAAIQTHGLSESFLLPMILNMSITGSLAILFVLLVRLALKRAPKIFSYVLWAVVLFRLLCPVSITTDFSLLGLFDTPTMENTEHTTAMEYVPFDVVHTQDLEVHLPVAPIINEAVNDALPQEHAALGADPLEGEMAIASFVWVLGMGAMAVYSVVSYLGLRRRLLTASPLRDNIYLADEITSPFVMGLVRPKIYLPSDMEEREQAYIIRHEQHHIRRGDHIIKALAFLALSIHWFNPLVWVAFVYSNKDMEMSCDEAVVKKMGDGILADYTASLLSLATGKHIVAGMPLAFGEGDTKGRIRNLANWRKPAFWVVLIAIIACIALTVGLMTNPASKREFPINGKNVSDLDTNLIVEKIADAEHLESASQLCVNADNFDLKFTPDFNWANDGAIRFFYGKNEKTYSAQLRMFHDDNKYFITERSEWVDQNRIFNLGHYLDALKYIPQEKVRQLSEDTDGYSVMLVDYGGPSEFERVLTYSQAGVTDLEGWVIHLTVQPLHKVEGGAYNGSGDEVIHLFFGYQDTPVSGTVTKWFDYLEGPDKMPKMTEEGRLKLSLPEFPGVSFRWNHTTMEAALGDQINLLYTGMPIWSAYFCDLTGDGWPEICSSISEGSGMIDNRVIIYDYVNGVRYILEDRGVFDYTIRQDERDGRLYVDKKVHGGGELLSTAQLEFKDGCIQVAGEAVPRIAIGNITDPTDNPNFAYDMAEEKIFEDENFNYYIGGLYSGNIIVHYTDGSEEDIVNALNAGRANIADLDKFGIQYWAEPKPYEFDVEENTVAEIGRGTLKTAVALSDEDATRLLSLVENVSWVESVQMPDESIDCAVNLGGRLLYYSSKNGTFIEYDLSKITTTSHQVLTGGQYWTMPMADRLFVNNILCGYIDLMYGITDVAPPEDGSDESGYSDSLDAAISAAVLQHYAADKPDGLLHVTSHAIIHQETDQTGKTTVFAMSQLDKYGFAGAAFHEVESWYEPIILTFEHSDQQGYRLTDSWFPTRPSESWDVLSEEIYTQFSAYSEDLADSALIAIMDDIYRLELKRSCYDQAVRYAGMDTHDAVEYLFEMIEDTPGAEADPQTYINRHPDECRRLMYFGNYTLEYIFSEFLEGGQTGLRGHLMRKILDDLAPEARLRLYAETGQAYFDEWRAGAIRISEQHDMNWIKENHPAIWLFLQMDSE